ncbi:hypothetical protein Ahu01nite_051260 [Winogradskya humida]|uniref:Uncharacterized protein n=1 Tax=Winogradskya humida TaxID=113566 RepID=A0ABQ3ZTW9_9ACTN|nr:hypothetical protein Ahu01nite_051260 [Actinoplanes humidus]
MQRRLDAAGGRLTVGVHLLGGPAQRGRSHRIGGSFNGPLYLKRHKSTLKEFVVVCAAKYGQPPGQVLVPPLMVTQPRELPLSGAFPWSALFP